RNDHISRFIDMPVLALPRNRSKPGTEATGRLELTADHLVAGRIDISPLVTRADSRPALAQRKRLTLPRRDDKDTVFVNETHSLAANAHAGKALGIGIRKRELSGNHQLAGLIDITK